MAVDVEKDTESIERRAVVHRVLTGWRNGHTRRIGGKQNKGPCRYHSDLRRTERNKKDTESIE
jgi:hypothetical protein